MQKQNVVSLWIGWSASEDALDQYVEETYPVRTDTFISEFARDFQISFYDEDAREAACVPEPVESLYELYGFVLILARRSSAMAVVMGGCMLQPEGACVDEGIGA